MIKRVHIILTGTVQGVFFRAFVQSKAEQLGITGFVRNCPNKSIEIIAEGEESNLKKLAEHCRKGPASAKISNVIIKEEKPAKEFDAFEIKH